MVMHEAFDAARAHAGNMQDPIRQFAIRQAEKLLESAGVIDPNLKTLRNDPESIYVHPRFTYCPEKHSVAVNGKQVSLSVTENKLLELFAESPNKAITFEEISQKVWNRECDYFTNNSIKVYVNRLRKKLQSSSDGELAIIMGIYSVGYMLVDPTKPKNKEESKTK